MKTFGSGAAVVWRPDDRMVAGSRLGQFMRRHGLATLEALQRRSTEDLEWFWRAVLDDLDIEFYEPYSQLIDTSRGIEWTRWCVGGRMNIVHNALDKWMGTDRERHIALRWEGEGGKVRTLTYGELFREVNRAAGGLRRLGLRKGDVAGLLLPMCPEILVALLALAKIGAVALPLFSGYAADAAATRLADAGAKLLIAADEFPRRGRAVALKPVADTAATRVASIEHLVTVRHAGTNSPAARGGNREVSWDELVAGPDASVETERTSAEDPLLLLYTSGTTGRPKGALHTHCGFPIKGAQDMAHCFDIQRSDTLYWVTDMGWMMGPWEVYGVLLAGATMVFYDGALDYPGPDKLWSLVERHRVTMLGLAPTLVRTLMRHGSEPVARHDLSSLRILGSTGEPWNPDPWLWYFNVVGKGQLPIINYSGGTEVSGGLVGGNVLTPLKPCSFAGPPPGIDADVVDEHGQPVRNEVGELVVRKPWIGMTRGFWRDPERYVQTYWSRIPGVWVHGDWAAVDADGLWYILGRSDDTIKVAGKRLGPAEIESVLVEHPAVSEAAAIGVPDRTRGQAIACFCVLRPGREPGSALKEELKTFVAGRMGKPLKPEIVEFVGDLPKTRNAKIMRRAIRAAYLGHDPGDLTSLENPAAVDEIRQLPSARGGNQR
jgi:acetyl-CoA synthetase